MVLALLVSHGVNFNLCSDMMMRLDEYLVCSPDTGERVIVAGMYEACDLAWDLSNKDTATSYVFVEDCFGDTILEYT